MRTSATLSRLARRDAGGNGVSMNRIAHTLLAAGAIILLAAADATQGRGAPAPAEAVLGIAEGRLAWLHPVTLRPLARGARVPQNPSGWARSPGRSRVALVVGRSVVVADARRLRVIRRVRLPGRPAFVVWSAERRLVAIGGGRIATVDPVRGRVVRIEQGRARAVEADTARGTVVVAFRDGVAISRAGAPFRIADVGAPNIAALAVSPDGRRALVFAGSRVSRLDTETLATSRADLPLAGRVVDADWSGGSVAIATEREYGEGTRPGGAYLVDPATWRTRLVDPAARGVTAAATQLLVFGHAAEASPRDPELFRMEGIGVRGYDSAVRRRFHVLGRVAVADAAAQGRYAYVQVWARAWLAVVDLRRGSIVRRTVGARTTLLVR